MTIKPNSVLMPDNMYYGFPSPRFVTGICRMGPGMIAGYLSAHWKPREGVLLLLFATLVEGVSLFVIFSFMYRTSLVLYHFIAVHLVTAVLLIPSAYG